MSKDVLVFCPACQKGSILKDLTDEDMDRLKQSINASEKLPQDDPRRYVVFYRHTQRML